MRMLLFNFLVFGAVFLSAATGRRDLSVRFLHHLQNSRSDSMITMLDSQVLKVITPAELALIWPQVQVSLPYGNFLDTQGYLEEYDKAYLGLKFEKGLLDLVLSFTPEGRIGSFNLRMPTDKTPYSIPSYADTSRFIEIDYLVRYDGVLPGTLSLPKGKGPWPLVILGHGSGPQNRDEPMGPNRVFRDIAYGLASKGIAVFRFDKRTAVYGAASFEHADSFDVWDECIHDLIYLCDTFSNDPRFSKTYLLGHSLSGYLAPLVATEVPWLSGLILLGAPVRPLDSLVLEQVEYLDSLDSSGTYYQALKDLREEIAFLRSEEFSDDAPADWLPLGLPARYWKSILYYDPVEQLDSLPQRVLILQGGDDYQVPITEFELWKTRLKKKKVKVRYRLFPGLGHGFFSSGGIPGPAQYNQAHEVDEAVIRAIAGFVK